MRESVDATTWISMKTLRLRRDEDSLVIVRVGRSIWHEVKEKVDGACRVLQEVSKESGE